MNCAKYWILIFLISFSTPLIWAGESVSPPKGISAFVYRGANVFVEGTFDGIGQLNGLDFSSSIDKSALLNMAPEVQEFINELEAIKPGITSGLTLGDLSFSPEVDLKVHGMALAHGLSDKTMIVGFLPVYEARVQLHGGFSSSTFLRQMSRELNQQGQISSEQEKRLRAEAISQIIDQAPQLTNEIIQGALVNELGYMPLGHWSATGIGDLNFFLQHRFLTKSHYIQAARIGLSLPTGRQDDPDNLVDIPFGTGYATTYLETVHDVHLWKKYATFSWVGRYDINFPTHKTLRLVENPNIPISSEKEDLDIITGDAYTNKFFLEVHPFEGLTLIGGTSFYKKSADNILGQRSDFDYRIMENMSAKTTYTQELRISYSTLPLFKKNILPIPFKVGVTQSEVLTGSNSEKTKLMSVDFEMYF